MTILSPATGSTWVSAKDFYNQYNLSGIIGYHVNEERIVREENIFGIIEKHYDNHGGFLRETIIQNNLLLLL